MPFSFHTRLGMAIRYENFSVYTITFSFLIGLGFRLHGNASPCIAMFSLFAFCINGVFCAIPKMNEMLVELIRRLRVGLIPG